MTGTFPEAKYDYVVLGAGMAGLAAAYRLSKAGRSVLVLEKAVEVGAELNVDQFQEGELVKISSKSKGKGFAGVVKRYNFAGGPKTHGQTDIHRSRGSIGASSWPSRVFKGMRMAGRMGGDKITLKKIRILKIDLEKNLLVVKGPVPGAINATVRIWN